VTSRIPIRGRALLFPVIGLYDFIYDVARSDHLSRLNVAYNNLMRSVLGIRRSQHVRISDMYRLCALDPLVTRRQTSLYNFMADVRAERQYSEIRLLFAKAGHTYATRHCDQYVVPSSRTASGLKRVSVRGLKLINSCSTSNVT
jgi:hypothetical protein